MNNYVLFDRFAPYLQQIKIFASLFQAFDRERRGFLLHMTMLDRQHDAKLLVNHYSLH